MFVIVDKKKIEQKKVFDCFNYENKDRSWGNYVIVGTGLSTLYCSNRHKCRKFQKLVLLFSKSKFHLLHFTLITTFPFFFLSFTGA